MKRIWRRCIGWSIMATLIVSLAWAPVAEAHTLTDKQSRIVTATICEKWPSITSPGYYVRTPKFPKLSLYASVKKRNRPWLNGRPVTGAAFYDGLKVGALYQLEMHPTWYGGTKKRSGTTILSARLISKRGGSCSR